MKFFTSFCSNHFGIHLLQDRQLEGLEYYVPSLNAGGIRKYEGCVCQEVVCMIPEGFDGKQEIRQHTLVCQQGLLSWGRGIVGLFEFFIVLIMTYFLNPNFVTVMKKCMCQNKIVCCC